MVSKITALFKVKKKTKYFARRGTFLQVYFCEAPWCEVTATRYYFEKFVMLNKCLKKEVTKQ